MNKILIDRSVVEQALGALELAYDYTGQDTESGRELCREARVAAKALRAALAEPVQEPVACNPLCELCVKRGYDFCANVAKTTPIVICPPQQQAEPGQGKPIDVDALGIPPHGQQLQPAQQQAPVANRAFLERILIAMEGVIDVADRKTDEFDALRSCVIDLTMMLHTAPPQRKPLTEGEIKELWVVYRAALPRYLCFARALEAAHGIKEGK